MKKYISTESALEATKGFVFTSKRYNMESMTDLLTLVRARIEALPDEVTRCKDCKWYNSIGCAICVRDETDRPGDNDFCSFAERHEIPIIRCRDCKHKGSPSTASGLPLYHCRLHVGSLIYDDDYCSGAVLKTEEQE